ncbi:MAG TPA: hypothetical protein VJ729_02465 [Nitrososphaeraceae archaeon]|nr:hypothetical protein [Nitrososphaeraceae archaeon]
MNHTTLGIVLIAIILTNFIIAASAMTRTTIILTFSAFAKSNDTIPLQKNNQDLIQGGKDSMATNIATNLICASPSRPCVVE